MKKSRFPDVLTTKGRTVIQRLRRENRQLKVERGIPAKAATGFAWESGTIPPEASSS